MITPFKTKLLNTTQPRMNKKPALLASVAMATAFMSIAPSAYAQNSCVPDRIGTAGNDTITCTGDQPSGIPGIVRGEAGDDIINITNANADGVNFDVEGDEDSDTITVTNSIINDLRSDSATAAGENDSDGDDVITFVNSTLIEQLYLGGGNDTFSATDSTINDLFVGSGNDIVTLNNSTVDTFVSSRGGDETLTLTNGSLIDSSVNIGDGVDVVVLDNSTIDGSLTVGNSSDDDGADTVTISNNSEVDGNINLGEGNDMLTATDSVIDGTINSTGGDDTIILTNVTELNGLNISEGADTVTLVNTDLSSSLTVGTSNINTDGADTVTLTMSDVNGSVFLGEGNDSLTATDGIINGSISSTGGDDTVILTNVMDVNNINISDGADTVVLDNTVLSGQLDVGVNGDADGADNVTLRNNSDVGTSIDLGSQNDVLTASDSRINGSIFSSDGDDTVSLTNVIDVNSISIDEGADTVLLDNTILSGTLDVGINNDDDGGDTVSVLNGSVVGGRLDTGFGDDSVIITNSEIGGIVTLGDGNDTIVANNAVIDERIEGGDGNDMITLLNSDNTGINFDVEGEGGDDVIVITDSVLNDVRGDNVNSASSDGNDTVTITNSTVEEQIDTTGGNDVLTLNNVMVLNDGSTGGSSVRLGSGNDTVDFTGTINGSINLGADNDTITLTSGSVINSTSSSEVFGGSGDDIITINGGTFTQGISGGSDNDTLTLNAGILGELEAGSGDDIINLFGGTLTGENNSNRFNAGSGDDTLLVDPTQSAAALDLTGITVFDGDAGTDVATFRNIETGNQLVDNVSFTQWETVTFENSIINIDDSSSIGTISLVNSTLNQVDGDLNLSGGSTVLTADAGSTINLQDGVTDDTIFAQLNANAGSRLAVDVDVMSRGFVADDSDFIIGSVHTPEAGVNVNVNTIGNTSLSGSRRIVDGGANVADPGIGASVQASSTYLLENDPSTGARRFWLQDAEDGGVFLVWTTPISSETASAFFGGGTVLAGTSALDADLAIDGDGVGAAANSVAANAGAFGAISNITSLAAPRTNIRSNNGQSKTRSAGGGTYQPCAASGEDWNAWVSGGISTSEFGSSDADSRTVALGVERDLDDVFETSCGRVAIGAFAYFGDSDTDADFGSNSEITSQGIGAYLRGSTESGFYGAVSAFVGENEVESFNAVLESNSDYDANAHGVALTLGKSTQISNGLNLDIRSQAFWGVSNSDQFTDSVGIDVDAVDSTTMALTGTVGLDKNFGETTNIYGRAGVKYSDFDNELNAFGIEVQSQPSFTTGIAEIGASKNFTNAFRGDISGFGELGNNVETYGLRGRLSVLF